MHAITRFANRLKNIAALANQRRMLLISGSEAWCRQVATAMIDTDDKQALLWVSNAPPPNVPAIRLSESSRILGRELQYVIYDAHGGFDADALAAVSGLVRGGGLLLMLVPPLVEWSSRPDPEARRFMAECDERRRSHFIERLGRVLIESQGVYCVRERGELPALERVPIAEVGVRPSPPYATEDQRTAVAAVIHTATGPARRPAVLVSDRGRGKSAALGIAAALLMQQGVSRVFVSGPRLSAVKAVFDHARKLLPDVRGTKNSLQYQACHLQFVAPDELLLNERVADVLLVDEAAAIPAPMLRELLKRYPRIVFATTVHGYEGSGRGFALRFNALLDEVTPGWQRVRMETPVRWANNDPVEKLVFNALLLNATAASHETSERLPSVAPLVECMSSAQLLQDETALSQLFGLLVMAHYRTRPNDLRQLLDSPGLHVYVLRQGPAIIGTALVVTEGPLEEALAQAVYQGKRRLRGHLVPQILAACVGMPEAACLRYARVMRIAIHPQWQRKCFGSLLLKHVITDCKQRGFDGVGASFGATAGLLDFWQASGFAAVRIGLTREHSSGANSVLVLNPLNERGKSVVHGAVQRLRQRLPFLLDDPLKELDSAVASKLLALTDFPDSASSGDYLRRDIEMFARAHLGMETVMPQLQQLASDYFSGVLKTVLDDKDETVLRTRIVEKRSWAEVCLASGVSGKKEGLSVLRKTVAKLIV